MTKRLTRRQAGIYSYIVQYIEENNYPPIVREIADEFEIKSTNGVSEHIKALVRKGLLGKENSKSRALRPLVPLEDLTIDICDEDELVEKVQAAKKMKEAVRSPKSGFEAVEPSRVREIPLVGQIAAGTPILAEENIDDQLLFDASLFGRGNDEIYALKVRGTSMIGDGILPGDMVFVRPQSTAENGEMIAAMVDGSATVKRYEKRKDLIYLIPSNPEMEPIVVNPRVEEFTILGSIRGVLRQYN